MVDRLLGIISGIDDDTIAAFGDFLDLSHLFYRVEQVPHELVRNIIADIGMVFFRDDERMDGHHRRKVVKGDYHIVFVYDSRRDLPCGNFAKDAVSHNARTAFPDSVMPLEFRMTVYCQMSNRLRKSRVSGCIIGGSVKLAHENINFLLRRRKALLQVGENCDSALVSLQTVFEFQGVAFEDRHGSVQFGHGLAKAHFLVFGVVGRICERCLTMDERLIQQQEQELAKTGRYYLHVCFMTIPLLCMACFLYGLRPLLLCGAALLTGNLCDRLVSLLRRRVYRAGDFSNESFALIIALLMPATVDWYVVIMAVLAGVLIGKEVFGGYGSYPFNPAAVGYAVAAVSWPEQVFRYPQPYTNIPLWDATGVPVSSTISDTLRSGGSLNIGAISLVLGEYAAPMGTGAALILLACGLFLWLQKDVRLSASVSFVVTCALIAFLFPRQVGVNGVDIALRLQCVRDELLTGAMLFSAVFLLNEPYTCAHHRLGRILYGVLVGAITMGFRYYGVYETGVCFALLTVNSISGWMDRTESRLYQLMHRPAAGKEGAE